MGSGVDQEWCHEFNNNPKTLISHIIEECITSSHDFSAVEIDEAIEIKNKVAFQNLKQKFKVLGTGVYNWWNNFKQLH